MRHGEDGALLIERLNNIFPQWREFWGSPEEATAAIAGDTLCAREGYVELDLDAESHWYDDEMEGDE